jgi:hypothetical protein
MENEKKLLPVGSVVYLKGGTMKLIVLSQGRLLKKNGEDEKPTYFDYMAGVHPFGLESPERLVYFDKKDIDKVVFTGYSDEDNVRYDEMINEWESAHSDEYFVQSGNEG